MASVTFYLNYNKTDKEGLVPIYLQFTDKSNRFRMYTGEKIPAPKKQSENTLVKKNPKKKLNRVVDNPYWKSEDNRVSRKHIDANTINDLLDDLEDRVTKIYREEKLKGKIPSVKKIKALLETSTGSYTVKNDFVSLYNEYMNSSMGIKSPGTLKNQKSSLAYITKFAEEKRYPLDFDSIDFGFNEKFTSYLVKGGKVTNNTIGRIYKDLKAFLNWASNKNLNTNLEYKKFKAIKEQKEVVHLTSTELFKLYRYKKLKEAHLLRIRDIFCLGCFTGLRISDLRNITKDNVVRNELHVRIQKTKDIIRVPLIPEAQAILKKYNFQLPTFYNQKVNKYIKDICKLVGINEMVADIKYRGAQRIETMHPKFELISTHAARRTFVTLSLEFGVPPQVVMSITGHSDYKTMKPYIKIADKTKQSVLLNAWK